MSNPIDALYLSPHLDDAVYSCGGLIYQQTQAGQRVLVMTTCAGLPPSGPLSPFAEALHTRWQVSATNAVTTRRTEDHAADANVYHLKRPLFKVDQPKCNSLYEDCC